jgi:formylglycine-generating enzyme required for sulfatase activity
MLKTYEFETLRLNERGEKLGQRKLEARYFSEDLGGGVQLDMVLIPPGTFLMGSPPTERDRNETSETQHPVAVRSFYMSKSEVTQAVWQAIMGQNPSKYPGGDNPVEAVSWFDAMEFCERLSRRTGKLYRLPSEAEWEYTCRAGTTTPFAFGDTITTEYVNFDGNFAYGAAPHGVLRNRTIPAGSLGMANAFGIYEMHGNVWEWCMDWYHDTYQGAPTDGSAWEMPPSQARVLRGGSWDNGGLNSRCANRNAGAPVSKFVGRIGFRVAAVLDSSSR